VQEVERFIQKQVEEYALTIQTNNDMDETIIGTEIDIKYIGYNQLKEAFKVQNEFSWPKAMFQGRNIDVEIIFEYNQEKLDAKIYAASNSTASDDFPLIPSTLLNNSSLLLSIEEYKYFKRSNEILHFNYQIAFMPHRKSTSTDIYGCMRDTVEDVFIGQALVNNNAVIPNRKKFGELWLYISEEENEQYSIRDIKCRGTKLTRIGTYLSVTHQAYGRGYIDIEITSSSPTYQSGYSWAIGDENGNLLIGVNQKFSDTKHWRLYFAASGNKIYN
jgi:hypothetical protein